MCPLSSHVCIHLFRCHTWVDSQCQCLLVGQALFTWQPPCHLPYQACPQCRYICVYVVLQVVSMKCVFSCPIHTLLLSTFPTFTVSLSTTRCQSIRLLPCQCTCRQSHPLTPLHNLTPPPTSHSLSKYSHNHKWYKCPPQPLLLHRCVCVCVCDTMSSMST